MHAPVLLFMQDGIMHVHIGSVHEDENDLLDRVCSSVDMTHVQEIFLDVVTPEPRLHSR